MQYPDPSELEEYVKEPTLFVPRNEMDCTVTDDTELVFEKEYQPRDSATFPGRPKVTFTFVPAYINEEVSPGEYERVTDDAVTHRDVLDSSIDSEMIEDYVVEIAHMVLGDEMRAIEAYWLLDTVEIESPAIDRE